MPLPRYRMEMTPALDNVNSKPKPAACAEDIFQPSSCSPAVLRHLIRRLTVSSWSLQLTNRNRPRPRKAALPQALVILHRSQCSIHKLLPEFEVESNIHQLVIQASKSSSSLKGALVELVFPLFTTIFIRMLATSSALTMKIHSLVPLLLVTYVGHVSAFIITAGLERATVTSVAALITASDLKRISLQTPTTLVTSSIANQVPLSAIVTAAPEFASPLARRQNPVHRCWNDQGFEVVTFTQLWVRTLTDTYRIAQHGLAITIHGARQETHMKVGQVMVNTALAVVAPGRLSWPTSLQPIRLISFPPQ